MLFFLIGLIKVFDILSFVGDINDRSIDNLLNDVQFDQENWKNGTYRERGQMVASLLESKWLLDKTKTEIIQYLGPPKDEIDFVDGKSWSKIYYKVDRGHMYTYDMILFFDSTDHYLTILFDD